MAEPEILNVPDTEAITHFRAKGFHIGFDWRDTSAGQHVASFTVAKVARLDILQDIRAAMDRVKAEGRTFADFRNELEPILRRKGWWGRQRMADPLTGQPRIVQLGSPHRLRIIFDTNLRMATAHGQWQRIERLAGVMPYLRYSAVHDARTRPEHLAWHGTVLPWDHPFWRTHYPPNGWRCRCLVQQLGEDDLERFGLEVSDEPPARWDTTRPWHDRRNGETHQIPLGIDPGFAHNVGRINLDREASDRLVQRIDRAPGDLARAAIGRPWRMPTFRRHLSGAFDGDWPVAILDGPILKTLGGRSPTVRLSGDTAAKQTVHHTDLKPDGYGRVQHILDEGEVFQINERNVMGFLEQDGQIWKAVVKRTGNGAETYLTTLHRTQPRDLRSAHRRFKLIER